MSWAVVGGAAIGLAGSVYSSSKSSKAAKQAGNQAADADAERLAFEREQYDDWQDTYGGIEDSLADYYETLSPTLRISQGLEAYEKEKNRAMSDLQDSFAQRGIETSGIKAQTDTSVALSSAAERARIRATAPMEVAKEKLGFLQVGLGQNPNAGMRDALGDTQTRAHGIENITARNAGEASGAVIDAATNLGQAGFSAWASNRKPANPNTGP